jgi:hypothetical protein
MEIFEIDGVEAARSARSQQYHEFLRRDSMSAELYVLRACEQDPQTPHSGCWGLAPPRALAATYRVG